jgi:hypothetical protein
VSGVRLSRVFWIGAATILIAAALVAVAAILGGDFDETDAKILGTLFAVLLAGATAISGYALVERQDLPALGWAAVVGGIVCFVVIAAAIWDEFDSDTLGRWAGTALAVVVALLLVTTQRLLLRVSRLTVVFYGTAVVAVLAAVVTGSAIWAEGDGGEDAPGLWEATAIFWILAALGFLLLPVLQRFASAGVESSEARTLATLDGVELVATRSRDGTVDAQLSPGERLQLRRRV